MPTQPDDRQQQRNRAALAASLLAIGALYSLPKAVALTGRKPRRYRQIAPTESQRSSMALPFLLIVRAWQSERATIMAAYAVARATGDTASVLRAIDAAAARVSPVVAQASRTIPDTVNRFEAWHRGQWVRRIRTATGLDVAHVTTPGEVRYDAQATIDWAKRLADDVSRKVQNDLTSRLLGDLGAGKPVADSSAVTDALTSARRRSINIGVDQIDKLSATMQRSRAKAAGLTRFIWHHSPHVRHPRPEHLARDNHIYSESNAPNDRAGTLWGCECWEEPLFD